jgi:GNAT superfamily N-acetyltransferase
MTTCDILLRELEPADLPAAWSLSQATGWPHRADDWRLLFDLGRGVAAFVQRRLVGTALWWAFPPHFATLGLVLVAEDCQRRGIGAGLMRSVLQQSAGRVLKLHATVAGSLLYERLGFRPRGLVRQYQGVCRLDAQENGTRRLTGADLAQVLVLDRAAFGADRARLLNRLLDGAEARVIGPPGRITGYALRRSFGRGEVIGPVVAPGAAQATALVGALLRPGFLRLDTPRAGLETLLHQAGLTAVDEVVPMHLGEWPGCEAVFGLASQATG